MLKHADSRELLTDQGRAFLSRVVSETLRLCAIVHKPTTAYHPQTYGLTVRLNRTLAKMLSMYVTANHTGWDATLTFITLAYNPTC